MNRKPGLLALGVILLAANWSDDTVSMVAVARAQGGCAGGGGRGGMSAMRPTEMANPMTFAMPGYERANVYNRQLQMNETYWRLTTMQQAYEREQQAAAQEAEEARQHKIAMRKERRAAEQAKREAAKAKREALKATQTKVAGKE